MYTLEDDEETSSRLNKRELNAAVTPTRPLGQPPVPPPFPPSGSPAPSAAASAKGGRAALLALTIACISVFFTALDQTVVVTALPQIITDLEIPITKLDEASWIISAYLLGFVIVMPLMGRVSDIYGRRRIFLLCLSIFGVGSILCALAPQLGQLFDLAFLNALGIDTASPGLLWLIAARLIQAMGGGAIVPVSMAIASDFYGSQRRGMALGIIGAVTEAGGVLGPLYGAVVVEHIGWQYIFYLNVPLVIVLLVAAWFLIPRGRALRERIDWLGALLLALALTCLSLGLAQQGTELGPSTTSSAAPQNNPIALILAAIFLIAFILVERKVRWPVVDLSLFKRMAFSASALVSLLVGAALIIAMADIPIFVDTVMRLSVLDSGFALLRLTAMIPVGALLGGWLCNRITCRWTGVLGLLFTAVGFYLMSRWPIRVNWEQITISTMTAGLGFGLVIAPIGTTAINAVRARQEGMSSAVITALRMIGMTLGLAALTSWALAYFKQLASTYKSLPANATADQFGAWSKGYAAHLISSAHTVYSSVFFTSMILCLLAIIPALFLWGRKMPVADAEPEPAPHEAVTMAADAAMFSSAFGQTPAHPGAPNNKRNKRRSIIIISVVLIALAIIGGISSLFLFGDEDLGNQEEETEETIDESNTNLPTPIAGARMFQLALDGSALTSLFVSQLNMKEGALTNLSVTPLPNDGLNLQLTLHIDANGIKRDMPIELNGTIGVDQGQNLQLTVHSLKRDGIDAGPAAATSMQTAMNQMISSAVMPALRNQLKNVQLVSAHTSSTIACGQGTQMLVLLIKAPPVQGMAAQPTPVPLCFKGPIDLNKMMPR